MENLGSLIIFFAVGFVVAACSAWLYVKTIRHLRDRLDPEIGSILRIRAASGVYRSHMMELGRSVWAMSAPLQRDNHVPLRVGEELVIEAASQGGALLFRSKVVARQSNPHTILIERPEKIHRVDRRDHKRWPQLAGAKVRLEGQPAELLDLSESGARLQTASRQYKGERVRLDLPWGAVVYGWVVASEGSESRVRFEELVEVGSGN
jgi:hypothetical protein